MTDITIPISVLEEAIKVLKKADKISGFPNNKEILKKLNSALAEGVQVPAMCRVASVKLDELCIRGYELSGYSIYHEGKHRHGFVTAAGMVGWWQPETNTEE